VVVVLALQGRLVQASEALEADDVAAIQYQVKSSSIATEHTDAGKCPYVEDRKPIEACNQVKKPSCKKCARFYNERTTGAKNYCAYSPAENKCYKVQFCDRNGLVCEMPKQPTPSPTPLPTSIPSPEPTLQPTPQPTSEPTLQPTAQGRGICVNKYVPYFSYTGDLEVTADFGSFRRPTHFVEAGSSYGQNTANVISGRLQGTDQACTSTFVAGTDVHNACGYHIHTGTSCSNDAGGHYWDKAVVGNTDPWKSVRYVTGKDFNANVVTGLRNDDIVGHAFIIHDSLGGRIACGIVDVSCDWR